MKTRVKAAARGKRLGAGALVEIEFEPGEGRSGLYRFYTHGMTPAQVLAKRNEIIKFHNDRAARMANFGAVRLTLSIGGKQFKITDCSIRRRGTDVELVLRVRTPKGKKIDLSRVYPKIADIPTDPQLVGMARAAATAWLAEDADSARAVTDVRTALPGVEP